MRPVGCKSLYPFPAFNTEAKGAEPLGWDIPYTTAIALDQNAFYSPANGDGSAQKVVTGTVYTCLT